MTNKRLFRNEIPMKLMSYDYNQEIGKLDLTSFPLIWDFKMVTKHYNQFGYHLYFFSEQYGQLASFPWWDHVEQDLKAMNINQIPLGSVDNPYCDLEESWQILIWEKKDFVYVMQGKDLCCTEFPIWFRVSKERYLLEWQETLQHFINLQT